VIHPEELSNKMLKREKVSLNKISTDAAIQLVRNAINRGVNLREVFVDTVGKPETYQQLLEKEFWNSPITFKVSAKADSLFPSVSAASIVAKVTRDREVNNWIFKEDTHKNIFDSKVGCGYPGDPVTKKWMDQTLDPIFGYPTLVRFSWKTTTNQLKAKGKVVKWENYIDDEDEGKKRDPFISQNNKKLDFSASSSVKKKFSYMDQNEITFSNLKFLNK
jgi:ribonuclease H2 subunit A